MSNIPPSSSSISSKHSSTQPTHIILSNRRFNSPSKARPSARDKASHRLTRQLRIDYHRSNKMQSPVIHQDRVGSVSSGSSSYHTSSSTGSHHNTSGSTGSYRAREYQSSKTPPAPFPSYACIIIILTDPQGVTQPISPIQVATLLCTTGKVPGSTAAPPAIRRARQHTPPVIPRVATNTEARMMTARWV